MRSTIRLGRVAGIPVGLHWSLLLIGVLLAVQMHDTLDQTGTGEAAPWVAALVLVVLFYAGLVAHEFGHALVARRNGVATVDITLWMLGGVARLAGDSPSAGAEARMALAGPAVSAALAAVWYSIAWAGDFVSAPTLVTDVAWVLAILNLTLAIFNLVPAFPLDGGRVLRAGLWAWRRDRVRGTNSAALVGTVIGGAAVLGGVAIAISEGDPLSGIWLAMLGAFVIRAGQAEASYVRAAAEAAQRCAGALCRRPPVLDPTTLVSEMLARWPLDDEHPTYLVGAPNHPDGFVAHEMATMLADARSQPLSEVAQSWAEVPVVDAAAPFDQVVEVFGRSRFRRVRVRLPEGDLGVLGAADLAVVVPLAPA